MEKILLIMQLVATLSLTGIIWVIQFVQYPFFSYVEKGNFPKYHAAYTFWVTTIVAPLMILELLTTIIFLSVPPENIDYNLLLLNSALTAVVWLSTFFIQVPLHKRLAAGFDANVHNSLVNSNWIRTIVWTLRSVLVLFFTWKSI
jgi:hypothetical protein